MYANSRSIQSAQSAPHERLAELVLRHRAQPLRKPPAPWNVAAFTAAMQAWGGTRPLILDSGCGVGWSSLQLAQRFPDHFVLAVDQSETRLARGKPGETLPENLYFARAELVDFWGLLAAEGVRLARHYILYPNPWPKIGHLARRWHGHAVFPAMVALGGVLESRSNWRIYLEEMALALEILTGQPAVLEEIPPAGEPLTAFERKYRDSGQPLFRLEFDPERR